jgi:hypothetical protein
MRSHSPRCWEVRPMATANHAVMGRYLELPGTGVGFHSAKPLPPSLFLPCLGVAEVQLRHGAGAMNKLTGVHPLAPQSPELGIAALSLLQHPPPPNPTASERRSGGSRRWHTAYRCGSLPLVLACGNLPLGMSRNHCSVPGYDRPDVLNPCLGCNTQEQALVIY